MLNLENNYLLKQDVKKWTGASMAHREEINPMHQKPLRQPVVKPVNLLYNILFGNKNLTKRRPMVTCSIEYSYKKVQGTAISREVRNFRAIIPCCQKA